MRKIKTFVDNIDQLEFGNYILFQEYVQKDYNGICYNYEISKPILGIYLGYFIADQAIGFNYVKWCNYKKSEVQNIDNHIEWNDYIDILGIWKNKPNWKQIISEYRKQNEEKVISENEFDV